MEPAENLANAPEKVQQYWATYDCEDSKKHLKRGLARWNRPWRRSQRGKSTYREQIIECLGAKVVKNKVQFVVGKELGVTETLPIDELMKRCPDRYAAFIESAFP
jgi:hypothetical protein